MNPLEQGFDAALLQRIETALDTVRPYLLADGGNVQVLELTPEGTLRLEMIGACGSCPASPMTLKAGIEQAIFSAVPEVKKVEAVNVSFDQLLQR
ncbi:NifU family protein [Hugenholtzia roseola]|uniref:NifU family protein n=1 Tax=Hugenholtzia roseola TaxID=1002 RepID=UPI0004096E41|nr:NifU family protein [Hugenholtzia roseola]